MEMTETMFGSGRDCWVCPNDRQLALRAKLRSGWSVHTFRTDRQKRSQALSEQELEVILSVIRRAEKLEQTEQLRIGRLVERVDSMRRCAVGNGRSHCLLCGDACGLLGSSSVCCVDCCKKVCTKCGIETVCSQKRPQWKCKICSEQREVWKRSGAWFYKALPKYLRPTKDESNASNTPRGAQKGAMATARSTPTNHTFTWARSKVDSSDSDSESEQSEGSMESKVSLLASKPRANSESSGGLAVPSRTSVLSGSRSSLASDYSLQHPAGLLQGDYDTDHSRGSTTGSTV